MTKARDIADSELGSLTVDTDTLVVDEANNRVGIGASSPGSALELNESSTVAATSKTQAGYPNLIIKDSSGASDAERGGAISFEGVYGALAKITGIKKNSNASGTNRDFGELVFYVNGNSSEDSYAALEEAMRVDSSGRVLFGASSTAGNTMYFAPDSAGGAFVKNTNSTNGRNVFLFQNPNGTVGSITTSGSTTSYNTSSDYRLKENVVYMANSIDRVKALPVRRFNFIADPDKTVDGFLAHEAQEIVPESVTGEKDEVEAIGNVTDAEGVVVQEGVIEPSELPEDQAWTKTGDRPVMQGIDQGKLVPLLTGALKEAIEKIESLEARIEALEAN